LLISSCRENSLPLSGVTEIKPSLIRDKALILNQRPRKCLNWKSPFEVYFVNPVF